ncbi:hypothetical protein [Chitinophaga sp. RAB17]|uniref:hypothetical protein n=1 Tax=Chitinophaga sp. RAB17 TaxID=3233049 RepID=UPI003F8DB549
MLFKQTHLDGIKSGEISLAFRRWKKLSVKENSEVKTAVGVVRIGKVSTVSLTAITKKEAVAAGFTQLTDLLKLLQSVPEGDIYRIEVRYHAEDPRISLREQTVLTPGAFELLRTKLARLDQYSKQGEWTTTLLTVIRDHPKLKAADLAVKTGMEKDWLKLHVRKLKNLGLTISHDPGYTLSPLGTAFLGRL